MTDEKQNRFEEAFERGQRGEVNSYDIWLQEQGFDPQQTSLDRLTDYFREHPQEAPNHQEQMEEIAEYLGFFSRREGDYHIPVVGVTGIGKTQFLFTARFLLNQMGSDISNYYFSAGDFAEEGEEEQVFFEVLDKLAGVDKAVIFVDDCEADKRAAHSLEKISARVEDSFIISSWTPERWNRDHDRVQEAVSSSKEVYLRPFAETDTIEALSTAVEVVSNDGISLPEEFYQRIHEVSLGIPGLFNQMLLEALKETFLKELELADMGAIGAAVEKLNLGSAQDRVWEISKKRLLILKHILLSYDPRGMRPTELVEELDRDKATISYHLQELSSARIVESEKVGRSVFYRVKDSLKPIIQLRIMKEGEHNYA